MSTPIFNQTTKIGIIGAHFNTDTLFSYLIDPLLDPS